MMLENCGQQAVVLVEIVNVLFPEVCRREQETIVFGKEDVFLWSFDAVYMEAQITKGNIRLVVINNFEEFKNFKERGTKGVG